MATALLKGLKLKLTFEQLKKQNDVILFSNSANRRTNVLVTTSYIPIENSVSVLLYAALW